jgi:predicted N-acyltransferase
MNFTVQIAHSVEEIGQEAWDHLGRGQPFTSYRWYRFGETVLSDDLPIYVMLSLAGEPVARAALWLKKYEPLPIDFRPLRYLMEAILRRWPLLLCQAPLAENTSLILPDDPSLREAALETIATVALDQAQEHKVSFLGFVYLEEHEARYAGWPGAFAAVELPEPGTRMTIQWPDFESYVRHLSKSERKHYRRNCRRADRLGVQIKLHPGVTAVDEALGLIKNLERRYKAPPIPWTRRLLENATMVDTTWVAAEAEGRLVGCELMLGDQGTWFVTGLGRDYDFPYVYFVIGYAGIRHAIEGGGRALEWGSAAYDVKRRLGFELKSNNYIAFAGRGPILHRLGRWVARREESRVTDPYADS